MLQVATYHRVCNSTKYSSEVCLRDDPGPAGPVRGEQAGAPRAVPLPRRGRHQEDPRRGVHPLPRPRVARPEGQQADGDSGGDHSAPQAEGGPLVQLLDMGSA